MGFVAQRGNRERFSDTCSCSWTQRLSWGRISGLTGGQYIRQTSVIWEREIHRAQAGHNAWIVWGHSTVSIDYHHFGNVLQPRELNGEATPGPACWSIAQSPRLDSISLAGRVEKKKKSFLSDQYPTHHASSVCLQTSHPQVPLGSPW